MADNYQAYKDFREQTDNDKMTRAELASKWMNRWLEADRVYTAWAHRFKVPVLYSYYEGFQHLVEQDENNRPYVVNMVYSIIEQKLPSLLFDNPSFTLRPHPFGTEYDFDAAAKLTQVKEDAVNYICGREDFGFSDKHELVILDAFFGFGVLETDYSKEAIQNPSISNASKDPLNNLYCKQIPFDTFRVSASANWDLSTGKWWGYYEYVPYSQLQKYVKEGKITKPPLNNDNDSIGDFADLPIVDGKVIVGENNSMPPFNCVKIIKIEDFATGKRLIICPDNAHGGDQILEIEDFDDTVFSILRFGKRRRGWYPLPAVFNWLDPQDEINDIRQAQKIHRKRFSRKYGVMEGALEAEEKDKFLYGPDGTVVTFLKNPKESLQVIEDGPMDASNLQSMQVSYADMNRVAGASDLQPAPDRQTATASSITNQRAAIRESKEVVRVANFLNSFARSVLRSLRKVPNSFWVRSRVPEGLLAELHVDDTKWVKADKTIFREEDYSVDVGMSSISPVYQAEDKKTFLEFLAVISQYEILSISPALLREAAYRIGYKNSSVLQQFQQLAQLAAIGKTLQAKAAVAAAGAPAVPNGPQPGQLPQQQVANSTPPDMENIKNMLFGNNGSGSGLQK